MATMIEITDDKERITKQIQALSGKDLWNLLQGISLATRVKANQAKAGDHRKSELDALANEVRKLVSQNTDAIVNF